MVAFASPGRLRNRWCAVRAGPGSVVVPLGVCRARPGPGRSAGTPVSRGSSAVVGGSPSLPRRRGVLPSFLALCCLPLDMTTPPQVSHPWVTSPEAAGRALQVRSSPGRCQGVRKQDRQVRPARRSGGGRCPWQGRGGAAALAGCWGAGGPACPPRSVGTLQSSILRGRAGLQEGA